MEMEDMIINGVLDRCGYVLRVTTRTSYVQQSQKTDTPSKVSYYIAKDDEKIFEDEFDADLSYEEQRNIKYICLERAMQDERFAKLREEFEPIKAEIDKKFEKYIKKDSAPGQMGE